jgi:hypothetical protein
VALSLGDRAARRAVSIPGEPSFARGLVHLGALRFLVGSQKPAAVYLVDLEREAVASHFVLDGEPQEAVYGIAMVPDTFGPPAVAEVLLPQEQAAVAAEGLEWQKPWGT